MPTINWGNLFPAFAPDSRGNTLEAYEVAVAEDGSRWLYLCGPTAIVEQVEAVSGNQSSREPVPEHVKSKYNFALRYPGKMPSGTKAFLDLMSGPLCVPCGGGLELVTALDWYKVPEDGVDPMHWANTEVGGYVYVGKYYTTGPEQHAARVALRSRMSGFVSQHPLYAEGTAIIAPPGHKANGTGFGERLAASVAKDVGIPFVNAVSVAGERPQRKGPEAVDLADDAFRIETRLSGRVIVVDDVYGSGETLRAAARAAIRAGAAEVFALTAVRRLRK